MQIGEGGGLGQCGDIHPHPGPALLRVGLVNVTSLRHHVDEVAGWDHDVVVVQKTKLTKGGQRALRSLLRERGWNVFSGAPLESRGGGGGMWEASLGGPAILARAALTAEDPPLPKQRERDPLVWDLWHSARWVHVRLALGDGSSALHLVCVYGMYGDDTLNRELWASVAAYLARLGNAPLVVRADFNFPLGDLGAAPEPLLAALLTRRLVDLDLEFNKSQEACMCRFSPTGASAGTRIDGILADPRVTTALEDVQAVRASGIPGHRPAVFSLRLSRATQRVWRAVRPPVVSIPERPEEQRKNLEDCLLSPLAADWEAVLESADVDAVWAYWTWAAEEALLAFSDPELQPQQVDSACPLPVAPRAAPSTAQRGRCLDALVRQVRMCPRQQPVTGLPETAPLARLHAVVGALRPVLNWRRTAPARPHVP